MVQHWVLQSTSTHQDHVIAHVVGATIKAYFVSDETAYLLLDIGFVWNIYLDGAMGLVPHPMAVNELNVDEEVRAEIKADVDLCLSERSDEPQQMTRFDGSPIQSVDIFVCEELRRIVVTGERDTLTIQTSLGTNEMKVTTNDNVR